MTAPSIFTDRRAVIAFATLVCLLWGSAVPAVKWGLGLIGIFPGDTGSLLLFAGVRFFLAGILLLAYAGLTGRPILVSGKRFGELALLGAGQTSLQYVFYYIGLAHTTGVKVSITTSTSSFFSVLLAHVLYANDRLTARRVLGCLIGFAGVIAVNFAASGLDFNFSLLGEGFIMLAALTISVATIYGKRISQTMDAMVMTGWQLLFGGAILAIAGLTFGGHLQSFGWQADLLTLYLAALSAVAFALWSLLFKHNPVGVVAPFQFLIPVFGVLLSGLVLGESVLEWKNLFALVLVSIGIWLVTTTAAKSIATAST